MDSDDLSFNEWKKTITDTKKIITDSLNVGIYIISSLQKWDSEIGNKKEALEQLRYVISEIDNLNLSIIKDVAELFIQMIKILSPDGKMEPSSELFLTFRDVDKLSYPYSNFFSMCFLALIDSFIWFIFQIDRTCTGRGNCISEKIVLGDPLKKCCKKKEIAKIIKNQKQLHVNLSNYVLPKFLKLNETEKDESFKIWYDKFRKVIDDNLKKDVKLKVKAKSSIFYLDMITKLDNQDL